MKILSLFDGVSCARLALEKAGLPIEKYYACEIDKYACKVTQANRPDTIPLGSVVGLDVSELGDIDLLIGGSPCQDLSIAKRNRKGLDGDRSGLFWEYVRILRKLKPKYFILENVASMPKEARDIITKELGVEPVMFNASLVSAQMRKRYFWTNIKFDLPEDRGIKLKDILIDGIETKEKSLCVTATYSRACPRDYFGKSSRQLIKVCEFNKGGQGDRVYSIDGKSVTLSALGGGCGAKTGLYETTKGLYRKLHPVETERLQCMPDNKKYVILETYEKTNVSAEMISGTNQKHVGSVGKNKVQDSVQFVELSTNIKVQQIEKLAHQNVLVSYRESLIEIYNQGKLLFSVDIAKKKDYSHQVGQIENFVQALAGIKTIAEKTIGFGKVESLVKEPYLTHHLIGKSAVRLYGKEMMLGVEDVVKDTIIHKELLKFTTLNHFTQGEIEQIWKTLSLSVIRAINGFTGNKIPLESTLVIEYHNGWTNPTGDISNTQRYKMCGNAFNVDVVAHILSFIV